MIITYKQGTNRHYDGDIGGRSDQPYVEFSSLTEQEGRMVTLSFSDQPPEKGGEKVIRRGYYTPPKK